MKSSRVIGHLNMEILVISHVSETASSSSGLDVISMAYGPGVDLASNRNEYQESSWGVKAAGT
jgi:hypothetical protein